MRTSVRGFGSTEARVGSEATSVMSFVDVVVCQVSAILDVSSGTYDDWRPFHIQTAHI